MKLDWNMLGERGSKEIYSSDFAMQYALAARGWSVAPWEETAQMDKEKERGKPRVDPKNRERTSPSRPGCAFDGPQECGLSALLLLLSGRQAHLQPQAAAARGVTHPLPALRKQDSKLFLEQRADFARTNSVCQLCYNLSRTWSCTVQAVA